jgi:prepilin-type N-terminal cleavage/methylation domain-containing protein
MTWSVRHRQQGGFTLIEVIIAAAIGALLLSALTSVVLTSWRATITAESRVEASSEVRNFEYYAYDDFAQSSLPAAGLCLQATPCTTQPLTLSGLQVSNTNPVPSPYTVSYSWDGSAFLDRSVGGSGVSAHMGTDVTAFSWYVDTNATVVVSLTINVHNYSETETFRFFPRVSP